ncbi:MAG: 50S ribosomal protein L35 [Candidatus Spechtbacteria bacterium RIFCSPHIGHO2_02_FULL_43_15b]|uniref:Large ribosomal subunit protein bL35 n=1 Tax=Candidatus Spechtbacteria bacterium RIFCSPHIGHO2_01_FULL_43_30 TaxID=1802158 RepID=A0A1G2H7A6_9BACT|nr:MAG: 50S ribosomal protein L35 [Candidatus Spechtbacteria bacterium RIFCSPHIGHO2_01_FULL_43_30]OGZ58606.1 MAG: 50S ribosomal protein L35 [Candidatus Spechtbacteria bacterium RIFCSPHIGHO2_02_FULL_43_15b]
MKLKTNKSVMKRFRITPTGKVMFRPSGQNHFNAKDTGKKRRLKRRWVQLVGAQAKAIKKLLPYA